MFDAESKKKALQEYLSFCSPCIFCYVLNKNLIVVFHQGDNSFLFYFYICIKFTLSTIILTMKKCLEISHLMVCVNYIIKNLFHGKKDKKPFERKNSDRKTFGILKGSKGLKNPGRLL